MKGIKGRDLDYVNDPQILLGHDEDEVLSAREGLKKIFYDEHGRKLFKLLESMINYRAAIVMSPEPTVEGTISHFRDLGGMKALLEYQEALRLMIFGGSEASEGEEDDI